MPKQKELLTAYKQAEYYKNILITQINRVWGRPILDSIVTKK